jgi:hypothetical protein
VSTTPAANYGSNDTSGKFATGVNNTCDKKLGEEQFVYMFTLQPKGVQTKYLKLF